MRQARILYPVVSWLLTGGDPFLLIWVMPFVNLLAVAGLAALGALLADRQGFNPWWGFTLPLAVCAGLPALRDLSDIVSVTALCALLTAWLLRGPWWTLALSGAAAMFARDPNVAVVMLVLGGTLWRRDVRGALGLAAAVLAWAGWMVTVREMYGTWSFTAVRGDLGPPGQGIWYCLTHLSEDPRRMALVHVACLLTVFFELALAVRLVFSGADRVTVLMALAGAGPGHPGRRARLRIVLGLHADLQLAAAGVLAGLHPLRPANTRRGAGRLGIVAHRGRRVGVSRPRRRCDAAG